MTKFNLYKYLKYLLERKLYYKILRSRPIWYFLVNREARALWRKNRARLSDVEIRLVASLKQEGVAVTSLEELFGGQGQAVFGALGELAEKLRAQDLADIKQKEVKPFLTYLLGSQAKVDLASPVFRLAISPSILNVVNSYLSIAGKLHTAELNVANVVASADVPMASQRWHRDPEDKWMCKVFLYLSDVDKGAGPFTYIPKSQEGGKWRKLFPQDPPAGRYPPEGVVEVIVPKEEIKVLTGKAGTLIFCDTSGLHKGGYATRKERTMLTLGYVSRACVSKSKLQYADNFENYLIRLNALQKHTLGL